jgi:50S ribosomal protein L16 3-hydroxylase
VAERGLLGGIGARRFLREYWQRKPLLVRGALPGFGAALSPDELAGLALEDEVESRLVLEKGRRPWELRRGPFTEEDFARLPARGWTLLVQAVDQWVPGARALRERFDFLPGWRFDDVMVSYAADRGGVGPHFDYYDVFLVQGSGRRRWKLGQHCDADSPLRRGPELRILREFHVEAEYLVEPGDLLYIPPGLAHWGIAEDPCMTWSVGFRAPSHAEILREAADAAADSLAEHLRFADPGVAYPRDGRIPDGAVRRLQEVVRGLADDRALLADWFARYMTERKYPELDIRPARRAGVSLADWLRGGKPLQRHPASRFAWLDGNPARLYVDGEGHACEAGLARLLCANARLDTAALRPWLRRARSRELLERLLARGALLRG